MLSVTNGIRGNKIKNIYMAFVVCASGFVAVYFINSVNMYRKAKWSRLLFSACGSTFQPLPK